MLPAAAAAAAANETKRNETKVNKTKQESYLERKNLNQFRFYLCCWPLFASTVTFNLPMAMPSMLPAAAANKVTATTKTPLFGILIIIFIIPNLFMNGSVMIVCKDFL